MATRTSNSQQQAFVAGGVFLALVMVIASQSVAQHQRQDPSRQIAAAGPQLTPCPTATGLLTMPEISSGNTGRLKATLRLTGGLRTIWNSSTPPGTSPANTRCATQLLRYFSGHTGLQPGPDDPAFAKGDLLPGPTLRAKLGDWVEIAFLNQVDPQKFANSLDRGDSAAPANGAMHHAGAANPAATVDPLAGCDVVFASKNRTSKRQNTGDVFPNCFHGSSTTNVHFHGTHTTPDTTGDNVLLFVRPVLRKKGVIFQPTDQTVSQSFGEFFTQCEKTGYPHLWTQMPASWQKAQFDAITWYDQNAPYKGVPKALPTPMHLWPVNKSEIAQKLWPQYQIGATPYCFPLPAYDPAKVRMGQSPGTHWYHAHKHGSTALNVANGMVGAFIIEGKYDTDLRGYYASNPAWNFQERVLMIQQLTPTLRKGDPTAQGPGSPGVPVLSVNGRRSPVITMRPNQVQIFRFINGAERDAALFKYFVPEPSPTLPGPQQPCSRPSTAPCVHWNQTAQDGVQFVAANYDPGNDTGHGYQGKRQDEQLYLAPANRADMLMQAPSTPGRYDLLVQAGVCRNPSCGGTAQTEVLLTVSVEGTAIAPAMPFVPVDKFPALPPFLNDIPASDVHHYRELVFQDNNGLRINGQQFNDHVINQTMQLNAVEEWTVANLDPDKEHPFHIHINPFQIVEVFEPQGADAKPGGKCPADPTKPATWKPCTDQTKNFEWWDTFGIPGSRTDTLPASVCTTQAQCPATIKNSPYLACANGSCSVTIPGHFKLRTRFVDFTGQYVLHCHILTHEDRGMMELIQVVSGYSPYTHH
jgi:FtsP/CotA-like multicopper oxidase with cupredoxin domain